MDDGPHYLTDDLELDLDSGLDATADSDGPHYDIESEPELDEMKTTDELLFHSFDDYKVMLCQKNSDIVIQLQKEFRNQLNYWAYSSSSNKIVDELLIAINALNINIDIDIELDQTNLAGAYNVLRNTILPELVMYSRNNDFEPMHYMVVMKANQPIGLIGIFDKTSYSNLVIIQSVMSMPSYFLARKMSTTKYPGINEILMPLVQKYASSQGAQYIYVNPLKVQAKMLHKYYGFNYTIDEKLFFGKNQRSLKTGSSTMVKYLK
jgi:hypothetical protein